MLEPVQGEAGVLPATVEFLRELRALTKRHDCLMIVDEIQTGMGRTGTLFAYEHFARSDDEAPDIMTLGKGLGGGVPLAALCAKEAVSVFEHGEQGGTFNGSPLMTAVGCAVMEAMLAPGFLPTVVATGNVPEREAARPRPRARSLARARAGAPARARPGRRDRRRAWWPTRGTISRSTRAGRTRASC